MIYGLPYKGSKNALAKRIVDLLPEGDNFVDCCCGGGAILHAAVLSGKYKTVTGFDINKAIVGLIKATMIEFGQIDYNNFPPVTKEQFYEARDRNETLRDWVIRYTCSFGYNGMEYLWGKARAEMKQLVHSVVSEPDIEARRLRMVTLLTKLRSSDLSVADMKNLAHLEQLTNLHRLQLVEASMKECGTPTKLSVHTGSMFDINFDKYDVIYFDPPYQDTKGYANKKFPFLMFKVLLEGLAKDNKRVFVSEYKSPATGYRELASFKKMMLQDAKKNVEVTEKIFTCT